MKIAFKLNFNDNKEYKEPFLILIASELHYVEKFLFLIDFLGRWAVGKCRVFG